MTNSQKALLLSEVVIGAMKFSIFRCVHGFLNKETF